MAVDFSSRSRNLGDIEHQIRSFEVKSDEDIVTGGKLLRDMGMASAHMADLVADEIQDALEDFDKNGRTRLRTLRHKSVVRGLRVYAVGLRQADRIARAMVTAYHKHYAEEIAAARRKTRKTKFTPGGPTS